MDRGFLFLPLVSLTIWGLSLNASWSPKAQESSPEYGLRKRKSAVHKPVQSPIRDDLTKLLETLSQVGLDRGEGVLEPFFRRKRVEGGLRGSLTGDPSHAIMAAPFGGGPQRQTAVLIRKK